MTKEELLQWLDDPEVIEKLKEVLATPKKEYGDPNINKLLKWLKETIQIDAFADSQNERMYAKHLLGLGEKIGKEEFTQRLNLILRDAFKLKNCNRIKYLYGEMKSFIKKEIAAPVNMKQQSINEGKIQELINLGIAKDREEAISKLL